MKIQNNVNYNSNPAFGTKFRVVGPEELVEGFINVLRSGKIARGEEHLIRIVDDFVVIEGKDLDVFDKWWGENKDARGMVSNDKLQLFLEDADRINLEEGKPLTLCFKFAESAKEAAIKLVKALAGGFTSQEKTLMLNESCINIHDFGDEIYFTKGFVQKLADNPQVIHVTE